MKSPARCNTLLSRTQRPHKFSNEIPSLLYIAFAIKCAYYRLLPSRFAERVMFSQVCVENSVQEGGRCTPPLHRHAPGQTHPQADTTPGQTLPSQSRHLPDRHPLGRHPQTDTPPGQSPPTLLERTIRILLERILVTFISCKNMCK